jgi:hypothetical protein
MKGIVKSSTPKASTTQHKHLRLVVRILAYIRVWSSLGSGAFRYESRPIGDVVGSPEVQESDVFDVCDAQITKHF